MYRIYNCIAYAHDYVLVALAAVVCILASFAAISLLHHARRSVGRMRDIWLTVSAVSTGFGIWATHFIAMLAFTPGLPSGYNISLTVLSLVAAIALTGTGLVISLAVPWRYAQAIGGAIVAGGIATMHYTGMAAYEIAGTIHWDGTLVIASIVVGAVLGALSLPVGLQSEGFGWKIAGTLLLTLSICSHHFTAMGAATIVANPAIDVPGTALPANVLAAGVAVISLGIIGLALTGVLLDMRDLRSVAEARQIRDLANASVEGLLVCDGETIASVNTSFAALIGADAGNMTAAVLADCFPDDNARRKLASSIDQPVETVLRRADGSTTPVELILRPIVYAGRPHNVIAVRDLRPRKEAERYIYFLAHHDALTGLPNRSFFNARLDQEIALLKDSNSLAVLCLDLDRFKEVNDLFGHAAGDTLLKTVASRVTALLGPDQIMARLGGDEFAVLAPGSLSKAKLEQLAGSILVALSSEDGQDIHSRAANQESNSISASLGIAIYPDDAADRQTLLRHADAALYRAKNEGRNTWCFYEAAMGDQIRERRQIEHDLRVAVVRDEMHLVYQPQRDIRTGIVSGFEALLRWTHPTRGALSPAAFIPIAEDSGTILTIGDWVLRAACREATTWPQPLNIAVNVSATQLYTPNFVQEIRQILKETGLAAGRLEIEITETALVRDFKRALATLRTIKAMGIRIAMDDFGTGYSSLSKLRAFPFDKIKIDRSFIKSVNSNQEAATIVRAVLGLGKGLGLTVLAEGVETEAELAFLRSEHCDEVQGYLLGRPAAIGNFRSITHADASNLVEVPTPARKRKLKFA